MFLLLRVRVIPHQTNDNNNHLFFVGCGNTSEFTNLLRIRNSLLGHSAPNLTSSLVGFYLFLC